jgi:sugar lactone lactonase YvrE
MTSRRRFASTLIAVAALAPLLACARERRNEPPGAPRAGEVPSDVPRLGIVQGLHGPESVRYDAAQDVYFVSNMLGFGSIKDGNGYIVRIAAGDLTRADVLVQGGRDGVVLDAPKGMAIQGDTLWTADIDVVRGFHRLDGAPLGVIDLRGHGAQLLNDVAIGPDGALYITDTGIAMTPKGVLHPGGDRVFRVAPDRAVSVVAEGNVLGRPNGITWDAKGRRWIVVNFDPFQSEVYVLTPGDTARRVLQRGLGQFDGVEALADGRLIYTAWSDSSLHLLADGRDTRIIRGLFMPADIGVDTRRHRVAIPVAGRDQVEVYALP